MSANDVELARLRVQRWTVRTDRGEAVTAQFVVSCTGMLSAPKVPQFPGHEKFKGQIVHTARYPRGPC